MVWSGECFPARATPVEHDWRKRDDGGRCPLIECATRQGAETVRPPAAAIAKLAAFPIDRVLRVPGVNLTALDIPAAEGSVRVELVYTANDALMSYMDKINAGEPKARWQLPQAKTALGGVTSAASIASQ